MNADTPLDPGLPAHTKVRFAWLAVAIYYCLLVPLGLVVRAFGDPLGLRHRGGASAWRPVTPRATSMDRARRLD